MRPTIEELILKNNELSSENARLKGEITELKSLIPDRLTIENSDPNTVSELFKSKDSAYSHIENHWFSLTDSAGRITAISPGVTAITGHPTEDIIGKVFLHFLPEEEIEDKVELLQNIVIHGKSYHKVRISIRHIEGHYIPCELTASQFKFSTGEVGTLSQIRDISLYQRESALFLAQTRLSEYSANATLDQLLQRSLDEAEALTESNIGFLHFVDDDQEHVKLQAWSTNTLTYLCRGDSKGEHSPISEAGVWVDCVALKKPVIHNDYNSLPHKKGLPEGHAPVIRELVVPIIRQGKIVAIIGVGNKFTNYTEQDQDILVHLSDMIWDVIQKKKIESELLLTSEKYIKIMNTTLEGVVILDKDAKISFCNRRFSDLLGYSDSELLDTPIANFLAGEDLESYAQTVGNLFSGKSLQFERRFVRKDGTILYTMVSATPIVETSGEINSIYSLIADITEGKLMEERIQSEQQFSNLLIESLPGMFFMFDWNMNLVRWNKNKQQYYGRTDDEMRSTSILKSVHPEDIEIAKHFNESTISVGASSATFRLMRYDKSYRYFYLNSKRLDSKAGTYIVGVGIDIDELHRAKEELKTAKEGAEDALKIKSNILANMSHEIRTPMIAILGYSEILLSKDFDSTQRKMLEKIWSGGKRLLTTLNLLLDLSRLESGNYETHPKYINLIALISGIITLYKPAAQAKGLSIQLHTDIDKFILKTDTHCLAHSLNNLVNNAVKFTNEGSVDIYVSAPDAHGEPISIEIKDTGIGINSESLNIIFDDFRQASEGYNRAFEGVGLGLSITKKFINVIGGNISVISAEKVGTCFTIVLPTDASFSDNIDVQPINLKTELDFFSISKIEKPKAPPSKRILIVENDKDNALLIEQYLTDVYLADIAFNAQEAIKSIMKEQYDLIIMDINLGYGMNGLQLAGIIKNKQNYKDIPIIATTAFALLGDRDEFTANGCDDYIPKPFTRFDLLSIIKKNI